MSNVSRWTADGIERTGKNVSARQLQDTARDPKRGCVHVPCQTDKRRRPDRDSLIRGSVRPWQDTERKSAFKSSICPGRLFKKQTVASCAFRRVTFAMPAGTTMPSRSAMPASHRQQGRWTSNSSTEVGYACEHGRIVNEENVRCGRGHDHQSLFDKRALLSLHKRSADSTRIRCRCDRNADGVLSGRRPSRGPGTDRCETSGPCRLLMIDLCTEEKGVGGDC